MTPEIDETKTAKGARTRAQILETALELFFERGYEKTTMRAVAEKAGVSVGNAYYYFASKEHLIQGFYGRMHAEHVAVCEPRLAELTDFEERLRTVLVTKIETAEPYHRFSGLLFKTAADPKSPLNPFSQDSSEVRRQATDLMARVADGAKLDLPDDLARELPELLWLYEMAIILFWIHDDSPGRRRTFALVERTVGLVSKLVSLSSYKLLAPLRKSTLKLLEELRAT